MKKFLIIASFLILIFYAEKTYACSCLAPDPNSTLKQQVKESFDNSTAVFSAKVLSVSEDKTTSSKKVKLLLVKSWKGKLAKTVILTTGANSAMCGYNFEKGKTYLIYAHGGNLKNLSASLCSRTSQITANKDIKVLDKLRKKG